MMYSKRICGLLMALAMSLSIAGCGSSSSSSSQDSSTHTGSSQSSTEQTQEQTQKDTVALRQESVEGIDIKVPSNFSEFTKDGSLWTAMDEDRLSLITVSEYNGAEGLSLDDLSKDMFEEMILGAYNEASITKFVTNVELNEMASLAYMEADAQTSAGDPMKILVYFFLYGVDAFQIMQIIYVPDTGSSLETSLEEVKSSIELGDAFDEKMLQYALSSTSTSGSSSTDSKTSSQSTSNSSSQSSSSSAPDLSVKGKNHSLCYSTESSVYMSDYAIITDDFYLLVPESWADSVLYQEGTGTDGSRWFKVYEPSSYEAGAGGVLFTIKFNDMSEDYSVYPDCEWLGVFVDADGKKYNALALYPTDAQFTPATQKAYQSWKAQAQDVAESFSALEPCSIGVK